MQGRTRSRKPKLELGLDESVIRRRISRASTVREEVNVSEYTYENVEPIVGLIVEELKSPTQIEGEYIPFNSSDQILEETNLHREEVPVHTSEYLLLSVCCCLNSQPTMFQIFNARCSSILLFFLIDCNCGAINNGFWGTCRPTRLAFLT